MQRTQQQSGFTLLETAMYIFVIAIIIGSVVITIFGFVDRLRTNAAHTAVTDNIHLLNQKITWMIRGADTIVFPSSSTPSDRLMLWDWDNTLKRMDFENGAAELKVGSGPEIPVTSDDVTVTNLTFKRFSYNDEIEYTIRVEGTMESTDTSNPVSQSFDFWVSSR